LIIIGKIPSLPGDLKSLNSPNAALTFLKVKKLITSSISCPLPAGLLGRGISWLISPGADTPEQSGKWVFSNS